MAIVKTRGRNVAQSDRAPSRFESDQIENYFLKT